MSIYIDTYIVKGVHNIMITENEKIIVGTSITFLTQHSAVKVNSLCGSHIKI